MKLFRPKFRGSEIKKKIASLYWYNQIERSEFYMKGFKKVLLGMAMALLCIVCVGQADVKASMKIKPLKVQVVKAKKKTTIKWTKQKNVDNYKVTIYGKNYTQFKYTSGKKSKVTVKNFNKKINRVVVSGFSKKNKMICSSLIKKNQKKIKLDRPVLVNNGYGEDLKYRNSAKKLCVGVLGENNGEVVDWPVEKYIIYRKAAGEKSYKKIRAYNNAVLSDVYVDKTVKAGVTYYYKAVAYSKINGKKCYSPKSKAVKIRAVDLTADYSVEYIKSTENTKGYLDLKITGKETFGNMVFKKVKDSKFVYSEEDNNKNTISAELSLDYVSVDGTTWAEVTEKGYTLKAGQSVYLRFKVTPAENKTVEDYHFGSQEIKNAQIEVPEASVEYYGSGIGNTEATIDLLKNTMSVYQNWD